MPLPLILISLGIGGLLLVFLVALIREPAAESVPQVVAGGRRKVVPVKAAEEEKREKLRERLIHAGLYRQNSPTFFYLTQLIFAALPLLLCLVGHNMGVMGFQTALLSGVAFGILGVVGPGLWLDYRKATRQTTIRRSIPDALDVITICVEAGMSLSMAIVRVSKDLATTHPLLARELIIVHRQVQMGKTVGESLRSFAERFDLSELRSLSSVVTQSERFGASIANALRVHGETLRKKRMQKAHEKAQKAAVHILLPTVLCIFPALFVVILGPAAYDIMEMMENMGR